MHCAVIIEQFVYLFDTGDSPSLRTSSRSDDLSATAWLALGDLDSACWANNFIRDCVDWFKVSAIYVISFLSYNSCKTPEDCFSLFFDDALYDFLVQRTNEYAQK